MSPIVDLRMSRRIAVARAQNGNTVVPLPIDFLFWTETVDHRSSELAAARRDSGATGQVQLWLTGTATRRALQQLVDRRLAVIDDAGRRVEILD